jgi:SAM-dependent methyltransferase
MSPPPPEPGPTDAHRETEPSAWIRRFAHLVRAQGTVLDLACGAGRHTRLFHERGHPVLAVDRDLARLGALRDTPGRDTPGREMPGIEAVMADLERAPWPFAGRRFAGIVVANYLWRPLFPHLIASLEPGGALLYETFARGNERFGKPSNPDFLLAPGELLELARDRFEIVAYEHGTIFEPRPACIQRLAALKLPADTKGATLGPGADNT